MQYNAQTFNTTITTTTSYEPKFNKRLILSQIQRFWEREEIIITLLTSVYVCMHKHDTRTRELYICYFTSYCYYSSSSSAKCYLRRMYYLCVLSTLCNDSESGEMDSHSRISKRIKAPCLPSSVFSLSLFSSDCSKAASLLSVCLV